MLSWTGGTRARVVGLMEWVAILAAAWAGAYLIAHGPELVEALRGVRLGVLALTPTAWGRRC